MVDEALLKIINYYGINKQLKYIHSEYFELDEAILNYEQDDYYDIEEETNLKYHITEEIADVMVMLKQFQYYYGIADSSLQMMMDRKISRQLMRIDKENDDNEQ